MSSTSARARHAHSNPTKGRLPMFVLIEKDAVFSALRMLGALAHQPMSAQQRQELQEATAKLSEATQRAATSPTLEQAAACAGILGDDALVPGAQYQHYKGGIYSLLTKARFEANLAPAVVYYDGKAPPWVRDQGEFVERFKRID
ncbi:DUF1653 domain-containing protein [Paraburkholderia sp. UCT31]|uniref:DUF1653 domain-containing protein n=1 Tax=Paraburkholderia sp. UCT31 TaxID=2615209 RepID=UPI00223C1740|nr:DUF1653 domain-containing protein [Paraburkholderia sp. UCT31]MBC8741883.1 DUF1653 domain-containing protein [Paraburkholderia sp. UCT31]